MRGIVKEDIVHTILEGYSINGVPVNSESEAAAKEKVGQEVEYELTYDGYRQFGMFTKEFYKMAKIIS